MSKYHPQYVKVTAHHKNVVPTLIHDNLVPTRWDINISCQLWYLHLLPGGVLISPARWGTYISYQVEY